jgi:hypothetical protein
MVKNFITHHHHHHHQHTVFSISRSRPCRRGPSGHLADLGFSDAGLLSSTSSRHGSFSLLVSLGALSSWLPQSPQRGPSLSDDPKTTSTCATRDDEPRLEA